MPFGEHTIECHLIAGLRFTPRWVTTIVPAEFMSLQGFPTTQNSPWRSGAAREGWMTWSSH